MSEPEFKPVDDQTLLDVGSDSAAGLAPPADEPVRFKLGQVAITRELGAGGMGKVYKGLHTGLDVPVAVKTMSAALAADANGRQRFLREARTAAKLDHPNIVRVLDVNEHDGTPYIVMEFVDGTDVSALLKQHGPLKGMGALKVIAHVADGLAHAHDQGIVHRDIKPHNIFVGRDGRVKLGDFGLARAVEQTTELTMPGAAIGTAHYMSPEQSEGRDIDPRSDIYSLGITAFCLITGAPPYSGTTPVSIAVQHVNKDVNYDRAKFGHLPDDAVYLLIAMTSRDAGRRPSAHEVHDKLTQMITRAGEATRVKNIEELLNPAAAPAQFTPPAPTPNPPAPMTAFSAPPQPQFSAHASPPMPHAFAPYPGSTSSSNRLAWIALAVLAVLFLITGGCIMLVAASRVSAAPLP